AVAGAVGARLVEGDRAAADRHAGGAVDVAKHAAGVAGRLVAGDGAVLDQDGVVVLYVQVQAAAAAAGGRVAGDGAVADNAKLGRAVFELNVDAAATVSAGVARDGAAVDGEVTVEHQAAAVVVRGVVVGDLAAQQVHRRGVTRIDAAAAEVAGGRVAGDDA